MGCNVSWCFNKKYTHTCWLLHFLHTIYLFIIEFKYGYTVHNNSLVVQMKFWTEMVNLYNCCVVRWIYGGLVARTLMINNHTTSGRLIKKTKTTQYTKISSWEIELITTSLQFSFCVCVRYKTFTFRQILCIVRYSCIVWDHFVEGYKKHWIQNQKFGSCD